MKKETIQKKVDKAIREFYAYRKTCKEIQKVVCKELKKKGINYYDVLCSYMPSDDSLCVTIEFNYSQLPCVFLINDFFVAIKKDDIDEEELKIYSI